jgi:hypothetical protein
MLAQYRNKTGFNVWEFTFPVTFNTNPLYRSTPAERILSINGDIVFGLARYNTGLASSAFVYVDNHSPFFV